MTKKQPHVLLIDINNITSMIRHASVKTPKSHQRKEEFVPQLILKETLDYIGRTARDFKATSIAIACDHGSWRKDVFPEYKQGREPDIYHDEKIEATEMAIRFFDEMTSAKVIRVKKAEGDDIIAVWCREQEGTFTTILSSDKDFEQLVRPGEVQLYSPTQKKFRESEDPEYDLFLKCIRGDRGDNIKSAFPRVRETVLKKAWEDPLEMQNLMETVKDEQKVGEAYRFNRQMISFEHIPESLCARILEVIEQPPAGTFNEIRILQYLSECSLKKYADMMEPYYHILRRTPVLKA